MAQRNKILPGYLTTPEINVILSYKVKGEGKMKSKIIKIDLRSIKGIEKAERLKCLGWEIVENSIDTLYMKKSRQKFIEVAGVSRAVCPICKEAISYPEGVYFRNGIEVHGRCITIARMTRGKIAGIDC